MSHDRIAMVFICYDLILFLNMTTVLTKIVLSYNLCNVAQIKSCVQNFTKNKNLVISNDAECLIRILKLRYSAPKGSLEVR